MQGDVERMGRIQPICFGMVGIQLILKLEIYKLTSLILGAKNTK